MKKLISLCLIVFGLLSLTGSVAQSTRTTLDLKSGPLINSNNVANLALVLSVEFPTVGAAYRATNYSQSQKYLGYFNSSTCYVYKGTSADGYFEPSGATDANYFCNITGTGTGFSGNFMNFASMSAIDIVRFALTGGDRYIDESDATKPGSESEPRTILQRANIPGDSSSSNGSFYASSSYFPNRSLSAGTLTARLTPFGASTAVNVKSCFTNIFFGTSSTAGSCTSPGNSANLSTTNTAGATVTGTFKTRVLVCSSTEGPNRSDMCVRYPSNRYKPVGEIQKNADKVRVAAFGYLLDQSTTRYGGVLRAPMKFVGPNQKDANGIVSTNSTPEWDATSGVFFDKPINTSNEAGYTYTGVINYLNRFGRASGLYKQYDPVGELYYEMIRYFQGKQPTPAATSGTLSSALLDGYPIYTTWGDPMQTLCQRNYAMVVGDNNTWNDAQIPGSTISGQTQGQDGTTGAVGTLNARTWTDVLTSLETNGSVTYLDSKGVSQTANGNLSPNSNNTSLSTKLTGASNASYLWAGVAYWANTQAIRADKPLARVRTFVIDVDENGSGVIESSVLQRSFYLAGKYGGFSDVDATGNPTAGEGNPFKTYINNTLTASNNEWLAADSSNSPEGYFLASQPERMITAIQQIFAQASQAAGNIAGGALNVNKVSSQNLSGAFYQGRVNLTDWSGSVIRSNVSYNTATQRIEVGSTPVWDASNILTGVQTNTTTLSPYPLPANRKIVSYSATSRTGITFTWGSLDAAVQTSLKTNPATSLLQTDTDGQNRLNYIRGDRANEGVLRGRRQLMGDIVNSAPVLKGAAQGGILDASYQAFYNANLGRTPTVYIGTNGGMLHAFSAADSATDANNGKEIFAYVPRAVSEKLNKLTNPAYTKEAYVDGAMTVDEAKFYRPTSGAINWGTVLVSGMGGGAQGLFALDVSSPSTFSASDVLWEFTDSDDADMGNLLAEPKIVKLATGGANSATPNYKWFVMVTSGYNNYQTDSYTSSASNGGQFLFLLSLEKQPGQAWSLGTNYYKIAAVDATFSSSTLATGMGMPGVAIGPNGETYYAYAGDLQGNMWRFDLSSDSSTWTGSSKAKVLFLAKNSSNVAQPITVIPAVSLSPAGGYQLSFGTGKFIEPSDSQASSAQQQSMYTIWDANDGKTAQRVTTGSGGSTVNGLITRTLTISTSTITISGNPFTYGTVSGTYRGWYVDMANTMERIAVDPTFQSGVLAINSTIPSDACVSSGSANQYRANAFTGLSLATTNVATTAGYLGSASILLAGESIWSGRSSAGRYIVTRKLNTLSAGTSGSVSDSETTVNVIAGRISWREISNF